MGGQEGSRKNQLGKCFPNHLAFFDSYYRRRFLLGGRKSVLLCGAYLEGRQVKQVKTTHTHTHTHTHTRITDSQSRLPFPQAKVLEANKWKQRGKEGEGPITIQFKASYLSNYFFVCCPGSRCCGRYMVSR